VEHQVLSPDTPALRKARGAFYTPQPIAEYLAEWGVEDDPAATVMDPTCGEAVFMQAAGRRLADLGVSLERLREQMFGVDLHEASIARSRRLLRAQGLDGSFYAGDFFSELLPDKLGARLPYVDAVIGNPPFVRYQRHIGLERKRAQLAALEQGVRLSGLASSWAALVVHACGFLKPEGRLAMVLPTELLATGYAEPVRAWLKRRFRAVHLVMFEELQFSDATEKVILVLARGHGGCRAFSLVPVRTAEDLRSIRFGGPMHLNVAAPDQGKWTNLLLPVEHRQAFDRVIEQHFVPLARYGSPTLGTVTGNNDYFCISERTRQAYAISACHVLPVSPPGTKHLKGLSFTLKDWEALRDAGEPVWMLQPRDDALGGVEGPEDEGLRRYLQQGLKDEVHLAYKCRVRNTWYRPPVVPVPDLFFTYMSHRYPRLLSNSAKATFVNSMHGVRLREGMPRESSVALPLLAFNAVTMLGAEIHGRSYGGGILKMEPSEAAMLPVPAPEALVEAWRRLRPDRARLERQLQQGLWVGVAKRVDEALLAGACGVPARDVEQLYAAAAELRRGRIGGDTEADSRRPGP
jgi:adenine-specific DNA-methyltransferase